MKDRPILFKGEMVRAILAGTKTQTRRLVKPQPAPPRCIYDAADSRAVMLGNAYRRSGAAGVGVGFCWRKKLHTGEEIADGAVISHICPHGQPGDRLWVRETFHHGDAWYPDRPGLEWKNCRRDGQCTWIDYAATFTPKHDPMDFPWTPSLFMPRWVSRITLEITAVRVERLNEISEDDAKAEGVELSAALASFVCDTPAMRRQFKSAYVSAYCDLWESINGPDSWAENPWVWVIEFRRLP